MNRLRAIHTLVKRVVAPNRQGGYNLAPSALFEE